MSLSRTGNDLFEDIDDEPHQRFNTINTVIPESLYGSRLDAALAAIIPEISRSKLTNWIKNGHVLVNGMTLKPKDKIHGGEQISVEALVEEQTKVNPEKIPLDIVFEDTHVIVINKPRDFVVHPGNGNWHGTILNAILYHYPEANLLARGGIVHRLDKDTTGLMVIAKTELAQTNLIKQLENRSVSRIYRAIVHGHPPLNGIINKGIGRDKSNRIKMTVLEHGGKSSTTHFRVLQYFEDFSYIECKLETGRTHQIRVHLKAIKHPLVGDPIYGSRKTHFNLELMDAIYSLNRQALHALKLIFIHPATEKKMEFRAKIPADMKLLLSTLNSSSDKLLDNDFNDVDESNWDIIYAK